MLESLSAITKEVNYIYPFQHQGLLFLDVIYAFIPVVADGLFFTEPW